jgi:hypothetical protein
VTKRRATQTRPVDPTVLPPAETRLSGTARAIEQGVAPLYVDVRREDGRTVSFRRTGCTRPGLPYRATYRAHIEEWESPPADIDPTTFYVYDGGSLYTLEDWTAAQGGAP